MQLLSHYLPFHEAIDEPYYFDDVLIAHVEYGNTRVDYDDYDLFAPYIHMAGFRKNQITGERTFVGHLDRDLTFKILTAVIDEVNPADRIHFVQNAKVSFTVDLEQPAQVKAEMRA